MRTRTYIFCSAIMLMVACKKKNDDDTRIVNPPTTLPPTTQPTVDPKTLLPYGATLAKDSIWPDGKGHTFFLESDAHGFAPAYADKIYLGAVIKGNSIRDSSYSLVTGYTSLPITVSTNLPIPPALGSVSGVIDQPSLAATKLFVEGLFAGGFTTGRTQSLIWSGPGSIFYNKKQLALTGLATPELLAGKEPIGGFSCYLSHTLYTVDMDLPAEGKLFKEALTTTTLAEDPVYVTGISYGREVTILVTMKSDSAALLDKLRQTFNTISTKGEITDEQKQLAEKALITAFIRDENSGTGVTVKTFNGEAGFRDLMQQITTVPLTGKDKPGVPLSFHLRSLKNFTAFRHQFKVNYPGE